MKIDAGNDGNTTAVMLSSFMKTIIMIAITITIAITVAKAIMHGTLKVRKKFIQ